MILSKLKRPFWLVDLAMYRPAGRFFIIGLTSMYAVKKRRILEVLTPGLQLRPAARLLKTVEDRCSCIVLPSPLAVSSRRCPTRPNQNAQVLEGAQLSFGNFGEFLGVTRVPGGRRKYQKSGFP